MNDMNNRIILFGTGFQGKCAYELLKNDYRIIYFADNNSELFGKTLFGIEIIPGEKIRDYLDEETDIIICSSMYYYEIEKQLNSLGIPRYFVFFDGTIYDGRVNSVTTATKICVRCVMNNSSDKYILFKENGECNYCTNALERLPKEYFPNEEGVSRLNELLMDIKAAGKGKKYDCVMGISGGLDSSYLLYKGYQWGLRILAVHIDDGFDTDISKCNIEKLVKTTGVDYEVIKPDPKQYNDLILAYLKAGVPNIAIPQDNILLAFLYKKMKEYGINYFLSGGNFALECILQKDNTYDNLEIRNIYAIHKKFGTEELDKLCFISKEQIDIERKQYGIEMPRPLNYIKYERNAAFKELNDFCGFEYYGRKHLENIFTAFAQLYWLPKKFGVDKRTSHLSSMIVSNQLSRVDALKECNEPLYDDSLMEKYIGILKKKLCLNSEEFEIILNSPNHKHEDYNYA